MAADVDALFSVIEAVHAGPGEDGDPVLDAAIATLRARALQAVDGNPAAD